MATSCKTKSKRYHESSAGVADRVDRDAGIIRGVKVLGLVSRNGRRYREEAVRKAAKLYEGAKVYINHQRIEDDKPRVPERSMQEQWGVLRNVRHKPGAGLYADLHYNRSHSMTEQLLEAAERFPDTFGLSHDASGDERDAGDYTEVVEIYKVHSVDVVTQPATNDSLFESVLEAFCPTGKGGKVDNSCSSRKGGKPKAAADAALEASKAIGWFEKADKAQVSHPGPMWTYGEGFHDHEFAASGGFRLSDGSKHRLSVQIEANGLGGAYDFHYQGDKGKFSSPQKGAAMTLDGFKKATALATAFMQKRKPGFAEFNNIEPKDFRMYSRMLRVIAATAPDYVPYMVKQPGGSGKFHLVRKDNLERFKGYWKGKGYSFTDEGRSGGGSWKTMVNVGESEGDERGEMVMVALQPGVDDMWFTEEGWQDESAASLQPEDGMPSDEVQEGFCPTGKGGGKKNSCSSRKGSGAGSVKSSAKPKATGGSSPSSKPKAKAKPKSYASRVGSLEKQGMTTSDAQSIADLEDLRNDPNSPIGKPKSGGPKQESFSRSRVDMSKRKYSQLVESSEDFRNLLEMAMEEMPAMPEGDMSSGMDDMMEEDGAPAGDDLNAAFKAAMMKVLDEPTDMSSKLAKLKVILKAQEETMGVVGESQGLGSASTDAAMGMGEEPAEGMDFEDEEMAVGDDDGEAITNASGDGMEDDELEEGEVRECGPDGKCGKHSMKGKPAKESIQLVLENARLREQLEVAQVRAMLIESGRQATPVRIKALVALDDTDRKQLIESWVKDQEPKASKVRAAGRVRPVASPGKLFESQAEAEYPKDREEFFRSLR